MFTGSTLPTSITGTATNGEISLAWERFPTGGRPLLLVNGLSSPRVAYDAGFVAELINAGFEPVRFDNRDAGHSTHTSGGYAISDFAADSIAVIADQGWDRAHFFGMSMGGMIVQQIGIDFPERVLTITSLMSNTSEPGIGRPTPEAMDALMTPAPTEREAWLAQRVFTESIWGSPEASNAETARERGERLFDYGIHPEGVKHQYKAILDSGPRNEALAKMQAPTLVLHGTADTLVQIDGGRRTAEVVPNSHFVALEGMGHDLPEFYWPQIVGALSGFVAEAGFGQD
jgi:pimeloyl-ACP methyl ester carboxylesterase